MNMTPDELLRKCTVRITTDIDRGSGFFVGPGLVLTCAHLFDAARDEKADAAKMHIEVRWEGHCCEATIVGKEDKKITVIDRRREIYYRYPDLALLHVTFPDHPCVILSNEPLSVGDDVGFQSFGYTKDFPEGDTATFGYEGVSFIQDDKPLLKLNAGQALPGLSGAPLLNVGTHGISGIVEMSRDIYAPTGGEAIPTSTVFKTFPHVKEVQKEYLSRRDNPWSPFLTDKDYSIKDSKQPIVWLVPYPRNPFFTEREKVLTSLHTGFTTAEEPLPQAINGVSGVGKTQIALEYAYRNRSEYQAIFWVRADSYAARVADLVKIARELDLPEKNDQDQVCIIDAVKGWLQYHQNWLLILDQVEHEDLEWLCNFCPRGSGHHILLTTRAPIQGKPVKSIGIEQMDPEEGVILMLRRLGKLAPDDSIEQASADDLVNAKAIVTALDGLPLFLEQAAAYINENILSLPEYLRLLQEHPIEVLGAVATTLLLSFKKVEKANHAAADLLRFCAYLHPDEIPVDQIIVRGVPELGPQLQPIAADHIALNKAIEELRKFSLVRYNTTTKVRALTVHRLVQAILRKSMNKKTLHLWLERAVRALNRAFPTVEFKNWAECQLYLPHVQTCLPLIQQEGITSIEATQLLNKAGSYLRERAQYTQATELIQQALMSRKSVLTPAEADEATSLHNMALLYFKQGQFDKAEPYYLSACTIRESTLGLDHPDTATSFNDLAGLYNCQGRFTQAEELCKQGLEIRKKVLGLDHPDTALSFNDLGCIYYKQGKYDQAEEVFCQALDIRERVLEPDNPDIATSRGNLARLYYSQGKYKEALPLCQKALTIRQEVLGSNHPDTATSLNDLAHLYYRLGDYHQAESLYRQACDVWTYILGPEPMHPDVATIYNNLAKLYYRLGDYHQAENNYLRALDIRQRTLDGRLVDLGTTLPGVATLPEHPDVATILNGLGRLYFSRGIYRKAEKLYQQALHMRRKLLDTQHPDIAESLNHLGSLYYKQARYNEAEESFNQALSIRQSALGPKHPMVAEIRDNLGKLYYRLGRYGEAKSCYQQALKIRNQVLRSEHPDTATTLSHLAKLYSRQGKYKQAVRLYKQARDVWEKKLSGFEQSPDRATILHDLASLYTDLGSFTQAEELYQQALKIRKQVLGPESPDTASSFHHLGWLYYNQGQYAQARRYYRQALLIRKKVLGAKHPYVADTLDNLARLYYSQGRYKQAEPLYQEAKEIREKALGPEHPYTAYSISNLGRLYSRQGKYKVAELHCRHAKEIREKVLGLEHPDTALSLTDLAWIYNDLGKYEQAEYLYQRSLAIREKVLGETHPDVADSCNDLAKFYTKRGSYAKAEQLFQQALKIREKLPGPVNSKVAETLNDQATLFFKQGKYRQAEQLYRRALKIRKKVLGPNHPYIADSCDGLAEFYTEMGDYVQAEKLFQRAKTIREEVLGPENPKIAEALYGLTKLYAKQEKYEQAEALCQQALEIMEKGLGLDHPNTIIISQYHAHLLQHIKNSV